MHLNIQTLLFYVHYRVLCKLTDDGKGGEAWHQGLGIYFCVCLEQIIFRGGKGTDGADE